MWHQQSSPPISSGETSWSNDPSTSPLASSPPVSQTTPSPSSKNHEDFGWQADLSRPYAHDEPEEGSVQQASSPARSGSAETVPLNRSNSRSSHNAAFARDHSPSPLRLAPPPLRHKRPSSDFQDAAEGGRKRPRTPVTGSPMNYGCPYRIRNPRRFNPRDYSTCGTQAYQSLSLVKRHVRQFHLREPPSPFSCQRCRQVFKDNSALQEHIELPPDKMCLVKSPGGAVDAEDGISPEIVSLLVDRKNGSKVNCWESLWELLFPNDPEPLPHHFEPVIDVREIRPYLISNLADISTNLVLTMTKLDAGPQLREQIHQRHHRLWDSTVSGHVLMLKGVGTEMNATAAVDTEEDTATGRRAAISNDFEELRDRFLEMLPDLQRRLSQPAPIVPIIVYSADAAQSGSVSGQPAADDQEIGLADQASFEMPSEFPADQIFPWLS